MCYKTITFKSATQRSGVTSTSKKKPQILNNIWEKGNKIKIHKSIITMVQWIAIIIHFRISNYLNNFRKYSSRVILLIFAKKWKWKKIRKINPSTTLINRIRMFVCLSACLVAISSEGNSDGGMYRTPIDVEFNPIRSNLYFKSVRPTVRTPVAENWTPVEKKW